MVLASRAFHGSDRFLLWIPHLSDRVGSGRGDPARPVIHEKPPDPTRPDP